MEALLALSLFLCFLLALHLLGRVKALERIVQDLQAQQTSHGAPETRAAVTQSLVVAVGGRADITPGSVEVPRAPGSPSRRSQANAADLVPDTPAQGPVITADKPKRRRSPARRPQFSSLRLSPEWEALIGGRWLNRIGALALILGIGFFLKYAIDQNWISETFRVALGILGGVGLVSLAERSRRHGYAIFAQGLIGAGLSALYLSFFAAGSFYHLVPETLCLAAMGGVTLLAFVQAMQYNSIAVALLAWSGGFLAPNLLRDQNPSAAAIGVYVAMLTLGTLEVTIRRPRWIVLQPLTLLGAYITVLIWISSSYHSGDFALTVMTLLALWACFYQHDIRRLLRPIPHFHEWREVLATADAGVGYLALFLLVFPRHAALMALMSLALGAAYAVTLLVLRRQAALGTAARFAISALILLTIATPLFTAGFTTVILWTLEAQIVLWLGTRWNRWYLWMPAFLLELLAALWLVESPDTWLYRPINHFIPLANERFLAFATLTLALASVRPLLAHIEMPNILHTRRVEIWHMQQVSTYAAALFGLLALSVETNDLFRSWLQHAQGQDVTALQFNTILALVLVWMAYAVALIFLGLRQRYEPWLVSGLLAGALSLIVGVPGMAEFHPIARFLPVFNVRAATWLLLMAALVVQYRGLRGAQSTFRWMRYLVAAYPPALAAMGFGLLTAETYDLFSHLQNSARGTDAVQLNYLRSLALATVWILYSLPLAVFAIRRKNGSVLTAAWSIAGIAAAAGAAAGAAYEPITRYVPVVNPRLAVMLLFIAGLALHARMVSQDLPARFHSAQPIFRLAIVLLGFELISAELNDFFRHLSSTVHLANNSGMAGLAVEGMALAAIWMLYSLIVSWYGIKRTARTVLYAGLGSAGLAAVLGAAVSLVLVPGSMVGLVLGMRAVSLLTLITGLYVTLQWLRQGGPMLAALNRISSAFQAGIIVLGFELVTGQTRDLFQHAIAGNSGNLQNLEQVCLSCVWLLYALLLLGLGLWRRTRWMRLGAIALFGISILKVFLYDLSFLDPAFRSISFAGLGLILLGVSFLYQRYRTLLLDVS